MTGRPSGAMETQIPALENRETRGTRRNRPETKLLRFQHQVAEQAGALDLQHDGVARLQGAQRGLQLPQIFNAASVDRMNHVSWLGAFAQEGAGGHACGDHYSAWNAQVITQRTAKI